mmetsp:Transcript_24439/g.49522  ORF Transcript_24439/g.49522 Transcript_24439/m.49522 type:complete len:86 (+) Transcript_24439:770-1027(+)
MWLARGGGTCTAAAQKRERRFCVKGAVAGISRVLGWLVPTNFSRFMCIQQHFMGMREKSSRFPDVFRRRYQDPRCVLTPLSVLSC